jgi:hypothetical protein
MEIIPNGITVILCSIRAIPDRIGMVPRCRKVIRCGRRYLPKGIKKSAPG